MQMLPDRGPAGTADRDRDRDNDVVGLSVLLCTQVRKKHVQVEATQLTRLPKLQSNNRRTDPAAFGLFNMQLVLLQ